MNTSLAFVSPSLVVLVVLVLQDDVCVWLSIALTFSLAKRHKCPKHSLSFIPPSLVVLVVLVLQDDACVWLSIALT